MWKKLTAMAGLMVFVASCGGSEGISFQSVTGITPGTGAGNVLSGTYSLIFQYQSNGCERHSELEIPAAGTQTSQDVEVTQEDGLITFHPIHGTLRGSISFENAFEAGGATLLDVGTEIQNMLRLVSVSGRFESRDVFKGTGRERLMGSLGDEEVDCTYDFSIEGTRKAD